MFCSSSGKSIEKDSTFCGGCGVRAVSGKATSELPKQQSSLPQNRKYIKTLTIIAVVLIGIVILLTQTFSSSSIVGTWERESGRASHVWGAWGARGDVVEFFSDGTGVVGGISFTWTTERGRLRVSLPFGDSTASDYEISGSNLTITSDSHQVIYRRVR